MNVSELDFDIRVGLSKVEENIVGLSDKECLGIKLKKHMI